MFEFTPPKDAERFESVADYLLKDSEVGPHPLLGKPAPTFTARIFEGEELKFDRELDKVVVLDFWATWCGPCVEALPELDALAKKLADQDVVFYAVNVAEMPDAIEGFLKSHAMSIPVIVDPEGAISNVYQASAIPQTVLIGKDGRIEAVHVGFDPEKSVKMLEEEIMSLLAGRKIYNAEEVESPETEK
jgi:thiol-disulfide isomerase/thioredoxin